SPARKSAPGAGASPTAPARSWSAFRSPGSGSSPPLGRRWSSPPDSAPSSSVSGSCGRQPCRSTCPRELLGRVLSIDAFGGTLLLPLAPVAFAAIVAALGPSPAFVIGGAIALVIAVLLLLV